MKELAFFPPTSETGGKRRQGTSFCPATEGIGSSGNPAVGTLEDGHDRGQDTGAEAIDPILGQG